MMVSQNPYQRFMKETVRARLKGSWKPGIVTHKEVTPRSYFVKTDDGGEYRRNRKMLLKSTEPDPQIL